jgi:hypothetical protein
MKNDSKKIKLLKKITRVRGGAPVKSGVRAGLKFKADAPIDFKAD